jgi:hypothetical protein
MVPMQYQSEKLSRSYYRAFVWYYLVLKWPRLFCTVGEAFCDSTSIVFEDIVHEKDDPEGDCRRSFVPTAAGGRLPSKINLSGQRQKVQICFIRSLYK